MLVQIVLRLVVNAIAIVLTAAILNPHVAIANDDLWPIVVLAIIIAIANAILKPILMILTCPFILLTLGLFVLVVNAIVLLIVDALSDNLSIENFGWAIVAGIIMAIVSGVLEVLLGMRGKKEERR